MSSEIRKNDVNLQAQVKPLPIYGLASDLTPTLQNHWDRSFLQTTRKNDEGGGLALQQIRNDVSPFDRQFA